VARIRPRLPWFCAAPKRAAPHLVERHLPPEVLRPGRSGLTRGARRRQLHLGELAMRRMNSSAAEHDGPETATPCRRTREARVTSTSAVRGATAARAEVLRFRHVPGHHEEQAAASHGRTVGGEPSTAAAEERVDDGDGRARASGCCRPSAMGRGREPRERRQMFAMPTREESAWDLPRPAMRRR